MNKFYHLLLISCSFLMIISCKESDAIPTVVMPEQDSSLYFPPISGNNWATQSPDSLNWDTAKLQELLTYLSDNNTRGFLILKNGKIVVEQYWGIELLGNDLFTAESSWYWASAGKSLTAFLVGIAQAEGLFLIEDESSEYLGAGWSSLSTDKEDLISIKNQLTMTTGLDYAVPNPNCTAPECLLYKADAGMQWFYHNAPYTLLDQVVSNATSTDYNSFTKTSLADKIGMEGLWIETGYNNIYYSNVRSAARFGLLALAKGEWNNEVILTDSTYFNEMTNSSQSLNKSYGYLWWLNGKASFKIPGTTFTFSGALAPNAPADLFAAMGKNGQFIDVIPSKQLVVVRMGAAAGEELVPIAFHDEMWRLLMEVLVRE